MSKSRTRLADLKYKIGSVIREKSKYDYCNINNALFIDFTNINYHSTLQEILPSVGELRDYVSEQLEHSDFGSIVLWTYIINLDVKRYQWKYTRVDNRMPNPLLKKLLDALYPFGHDVTHHYGFLPRG